MTKALFQVAMALAIALSSIAAAPDGGNDAIPSGAESCGVAGGTLTMLATDNASEFAAFSLFDAKGTEIAKQFIPTYNPDASAELMLTAFGYGTEVASVKCLADSRLRRCTDSKWPPVEQGVGVTISGVLIGDDWAVVSIKGKYVNVDSPIAGNIDGSNIGFQLDKDPIRWSALYDSQTEASQAYFGLQSGDHTLTVGSRDAGNGTFVAQDRLCFNS
jgi:hypothetical protein